MKLLLDTHALVWSLIEVDRLSEAARYAIESPDTAVFVSVISIWEIAIKVGIGKWPQAEIVLRDMEQLLATSGMEILVPSIAHVRAAGLMPSPHRDPFDRLLAEQAQLEGLTLVTSDAKAQSLGVTWMW